MKITASGMADMKEAVGLLSDMVSIESINPEYTGGERGETEMVRYIASYLDKYSIPYTLSEVLPGRCNITAKLEGKKKSSLLLQSHMDTVAVEGMTVAPFDPVIKDGKLYGRGSCDAKGSVAMMLYALKLLKENGVTPAGDIYFTAAVEEEFSFTGVKHMIESGFKADGGVVGEPTSLRIGTACKGCVRFDIDVFGRAGHSSRPYEGHSAIQDMAKLLRLIDTELEEHYKTICHPLLGRPTLVPALIKGGSFINSVPEHCVIQIDRRVLPGEDFNSVKAELQPLIDKLAQADPDFRAEIGDAWLTDYAMEIPETAPIVKACRKAAESILGEAVLEGMMFSCDASKLTPAGTPTVIFGPGSIIHAHTADEFIEIDELTKAAEFYAQLCMDFDPSK